MSELKPCPFCACAMNVHSNRDWHRPEGDHEDHCPIYDTDLMFPATDIGLSALVNCWNTRVTQPEATKPAQDLSAAILDMIGENPNDPGSFAAKDWDDGFEACRKAAAAVASPADALVAGDRVDSANVVKLTDEQYLKILEPVLSRYGMQRYLNGDEITLDPSDYRAIINAAIQAQKDGHHE